MPVTAGASVSAEIRGLKETQQKMDQVARDLHGTPMLEGMRDATMLVSRDARIFAPVDTGRLRASITPEVRTEGNNVVGVVGSNVAYAPYMELGTGVYVGRPAYFPPPAALEVWARRHGGASGLQVAFAIFRAGGLKGRKFLERGFQTNEPRIIQLIGNVVTRIVKK